MSSLVPKLRFKEFSGEWEEEKVKKIFSIFQGFSFSSKDSVASGVRWLKITDVGIQKMNNDSPSFLPSNYKIKYQQFALKKGDYVIALTRPILNKKLKISPVNAIFEGALLNQRVGKLITNQNIEFVYFFLQTSYMIVELESSISGTEPPNLSAQKLQNINAFIPPPPEQQKIAACLSSLDALIEATSKKGEALKKHKKGLMQQLFPSEGEKEPKLRFDGFSGVWEEKLLGKVYDFFPTNSFSRDKLNYEKGLVKNIHYGDIHIKFSTLFDITKEKVPYINKSVELERIKKEYYCIEGDLVFADASEDLDDIGKSMEIINLNNEKLLSGLHTLLARQKEKILIKGFSGHLFKSNFIRNQIKKESQGTKVLGISTKRLNNTILFFPADEKEQQKIASCLSSIDTLIEATNKKVEVLKKHKKGLMQQLFVSAEASA